MDKALASGAGDSRFESWAGHLRACVHSLGPARLQREVAVLTTAQWGHCLLSYAISALASLPPGSDACGLPGEPGFAASCR